MNRSLVIIRNPGERVEDTKFEVYLKSTLTGPKMSNLLKH